MVAAVYEEDNGATSSLKSTRCVDWASIGRRLHFEVVKHRASGSQHFSIHRCFSMPRRCTLNQIACNSLLCVAIQVIEVRDGCFTRSASRPLDFTRSASRPLDAGPRTLRRGRVKMPFGREQNREYQLARYHRLRREAIARAGGKCVHCGDGSAGSASDGVDPGSELGFEYATGCEPTDGGSQLAKIWSKSKERIERELLRCVLLCRTCRTRKRSTERAEERGHGTITSYKYGCRCEACREIYNAYKREWRARQARELPAQKTQTDMGMIDATREDDVDEADVISSSERARARTRSSGREADRVRSVKTSLRACG